MEIPSVVFCVTLQTFQPTIQLTNGHNLLGEGSKKKNWINGGCGINQYDCLSSADAENSPRMFSSMMTLWKSHFTSYATTWNDKSEVLLWVGMCSFYVFLIFWCRAGSSLPLSPVHHVALRTAGIVDPGLLTLAKTPHISEFSGIR